MKKYRYLYKWLIISYILIIFFINLYTLKKHMSNIVETLPSYDVQVEISHCNDIFEAPGIGPMWPVHRINCWIHPCAICKFGLQTHMGSGTFSQDGPRTNISLPPLHSLAPSLSSETMVWAFVLDDVSASVNTVLYENFSLEIARQ